MAAGTETAIRSYCRAFSVNPAVGLHWTLTRLAELRVRLERMRLPSAGIPLTAAAGIPGRGLYLLENAILKEKGNILRRIRRLQVLFSPNAPWHGTGSFKANRKLTILQLRADNLFRTLDLFHDAVAARTDNDMGLLLAGLDKLVAAALHRPIPGYRPPMGISYLDSGTRGGAINRARTTLPGGVILPLAMIRVSPEILPTRLTSILHEAGHQLSVDLNLLPEAERAIFNGAKHAGLDDAEANLWRTWCSELMADAWACCLGGGAPAVDGLQRVMSLPAPLLYLIKPGDPHPPGILRAPFCIAFSQIVHSSSVLHHLDQRFFSVYGKGRVSAALTRKVERLAMAVHSVAEILATHRFEGLGRRCIIQAGMPWMVSPFRIERWLQNKDAVHPQILSRMPPLQALAILGFARIKGRLSANAHDRLARRWLKRMAMNRFAPKHTHDYKGGRISCIRQTDASFIKPIK